MQDATQNQTVASRARSVYDDIVSTSLPARLRSCSEWCGGHDDEELELSDAQGVVHHGKYVADEHLGEIRRMGGETVTRPGGASWDIGIVQETFSDRRPVTDAVVELGARSADQHRVGLLLTPGEARELAAALVHAADMVLFR